jgi:prepilin-type N-terminal cleavage/methylation domain-containing protein
MARQGHPSAESQKEDTEMARMKRTAFTVLELLIVIAIIALIAALLFPLFASARKKARETQCMNNLHQVYVAWSLYTSDYQDTAPIALDFILPYVKDRAVLVCPLDQYGGLNTDATAHAQTPISYDYKGLMFGNDPLPKPLQSIRAIREKDPNFGFLFCYLHGRLIYPGLPHPTEHAFCGKVLRVRRDGSIQAKDVPIRKTSTGAGSGKEGRCAWELLTDLPMPDDHGRDGGPEEICHGTIVCTR